MRRAALCRPPLPKNGVKMNGRSIALFVFILISSSVAVQADRIAFDAGYVECGWVNETTLVVAAQLNEVLGQNGTWVLTVIADRFDDGIFAWQLHASASYKSVLVMPNDFLTARNFLPESLDVETDLAEDGGKIEVRIPKDGPIPNLVAPGDLIRIHALWIGSEPLVEFPVPDFTVRISAGGGGGAEEGGIRTDPLPAGSVFPRGEKIANSFVLIDPDTGSPRLYVAASYSLLRIREGKADEFLRFAQIEQDRETGLLSYEIDTARLTPGKYRLIVTVGPGEERFEKVLEIVSPAG